ncbi:hypothetical protein HS045_02500 [Planomonospora sp. ID82291]|nr:hypothetical protein [Planomonospora sp. ID82291]MBG0813099.1 hypothetical protein [Planomonospora sp. ID82291]
MPSSPTPGAGTACGAASPSSSTWMTRASGRWSIRTDAVVAAACRATLVSDS